MSGSLWPPWTITYQTPLTMGFSRWEYWSGLPFPFPRDLPNPGIKLRSPALQADALPSEPLGKPSPILSSFQKPTSYLKLRCGWKELVTKNKRPSESYPSYLLGNSKGFRTFMSEQGSRQNTYFLLKVTIPQWGGENAKITGAGT